MHHQVATHLTANLKGVTHEEGSFGNRMCDRSLRRSRLQHAGERLWSGEAQHVAHAEHVDDRAGAAEVQEGTQLQPVPPVLSRMRRQRLRSLLLGQLLDLIAGHGTFDPRPTPGRGFCYALSAIT